jgi:hypothetical protein
LLTARRNPYLVAYLSVIFCRENQLKVRNKRERRNEEKEEERMKVRKIEEEEKGNT